MENGNGILETATPHPALSRKGGGNDNGNSNDKSFISFWIATGDCPVEGRPRNDDTSDKRHGNGKVENGNGF
jgi:hypothetical protein